MQLDDIALEIQRTKELTRQRKRHEKEFQETWNEINMDQWRTNQKVARERKNLQTIVDQRITSRKVQMKKQENLNARTKAISSIDEFEERLSSMRIKQDSADNTLSIDIRSAGGEEGTGIPTLSYMNEETLREGMVKNQKIMQERNEKIRLKRQDHDKRRKRFVRLRESHHSSMLHADADKEIIEQVLVTSQVEDIEKFAKLRFMSNANMMMQNEKNLHSIYDVKAKIAADDMEKCKMQDAVLERDCVIAHHMESQASRLSVAKEANASALRIETLETAQRELTRMLDITDWIVNMRALGVYEGGLDVPTEGVMESEETILPNILLRDAKKMYCSEDIAVPDALPVMNPTNVFDDYPDSLSWRPLSTKTEWLFEDAFKAGKYMKNANHDSEADESTMANYLNEGDSKSFIEQISNFEPKPMEEVDDSGGKKDKKKDAKKDTKKGKGKGKDEENVPETGIKIVTPAWVGQTSPHCLLGETVVNMRCIAEPIPEPPQVPDCIPSLRTRIILCGPSAFMKQKVAQAISKELGLTILNVNELLASAMDNGANDTGAESSCATLSARIYADALEGRSVCDDDYVALLVEAITKLDANGEGFIIEDFPNTEEQAFNLVTAVSGIDYNQHRPQPKDMASEFLTSNEREEIVFDYEQCGFDHVFFLSSDPLSIVSNRVTTREDYLTNEIVSITAETQKVDTLAEVVTPNNPMDTLSFLLSNSSQAIGPIRDFTARLGIARDVAVEDDTDVSKAVESILLTINPVSEESDIVENAAEKTDEVAQVEDNDTEVKPEKQGSSDNNEVTEEVAAVHPPLILQEGALPPKLAKVLNKLWSDGEKQVTNTSIQFFSGLRDVQYQMVQRRGGIRNAVTRSLLRRDNKQDLLDSFREKFNSFEMDFRFDADLINELYLRTLELRDKFWSLTEERSSQANEIIESVSRDSSVKVLIHNVEAEGAQLLQMYTNLFVNGLNVMFDHMRAVSTYEYNKSVAQILEEVDPIPEDYLGLNDNPSSNGKGDKDKGKGKAPPVAKRVGIACPIVWNDMETSIPQPVPKVEEEPDTGKKKGKEKKGDVEEVAPSPFAVSREKALGFCSGWCRDTFTVEQELYGDDEALARAIEKSIWHEADRFTHMIELLTSLVSSQSQWLSDQESEILELMQKMVDKRKTDELATTERLCEMIYQCIENNVPIRTQWQLAPDVIVVREERLVYPPEPITETVEMNKFYVSSMNEEQTSLASEMLHQIQLGNSSILKEDLCEWLNVCNSGIGPVGCNSSLKDSFKNLSFPKQWQIHDNQLLSNIYSPIPVLGTSEETGVTKLEKVMENLTEFRNKI